MRAYPLPLTVVALVGTLLLGACDSEGETDGAGAGSAAPGGACGIGDVKIEAGPAAEAPAAGDTGNLPVTLTNQGAECVLDGFPGLRLESGQDAVDVPADKAATAQKLTLAKDTAATFTITYVRGEKGGPGTVDATNVRLSLPGGDESTDLPWSYGPVAAADGGAPDASVSAFQQAGD
ncbi:DUF4232 domain-containing protein [Streptomyces sp. NPDC088387]|uniref:DUF4232 domain-containing protein n=1 Tax=Streptomyces sp. NPDC088387 TaxID=3365859 RepID=UPI00381F94C6